MGSLLCGLFVDLVVVNWLSSYQGKQQGNTSDHCSEDIGTEGSSCMLDKLTLEERQAIIHETAGAIKKLASENKVVSLLYGNAFTFTLNANDTFGYACADAVEVAIEDIPKLLEVYEKFGNDGINAFMSRVRDGEDVLPELQNDQYRAAVEFLSTYKPCSWVTA
jgi:hypothetical protein